MDFGQFDDSFAVEVISFIMLNRGIVELNTLKRQYYSYNLCSIPITGRLRKR